MNDSAAITPRLGRPRRAWIAVVLSLLQLGMGHLYCGRPRRAAAAMLIPAGAGALAITLTLMEARLAIAVLPVTIALSIAAMVDAAVVARRSATPFVLARYQTWYGYLGVWVLMAIIGNVITGTIKEKLLEAYRISSQSMLPTVLLGDWLYVDKRASARSTIGRGSLAVFRSVEEDATLLKRVVGVGGDTLRMSHDSLFRNGQWEPESYAWTDKTLASDSAWARTMSSWEPIVVPPGAIFVMGDNRYGSKDSRTYGPVPLANVVAVPRAIYYSFDPDGDSAIPALTAIRWSRIGLVPR